MNYATTFCQNVRFFGGRKQNARIAGRGKRWYTDKKNGIMRPARIPARRAAAKEKV